MARGNEYVRHALLIAMVVLAVAAVASAQTTNDPASLATKLADLRARPIPESEALLYQELNAIGEQQNEMREITGVKDGFASAQKSIDGLPRDYQAMAERAATIECRGADTVSFMAMYTDLNRVFNNLFMEFDLESDAMVPYSAARSGTPEERCAALKRALTPAAKAAFSTAVDRLRTDLQARQKEDAEMRQLAAQIQTVLEARKTQVAEQLKNASAEQNVRQSLPYVIGLIAAASILVLLVVRLFAMDLQHEWIVSGQVTQFVTVMVLLSVIMALGLAGILHEETLGTLLGGVGGYVLSQGVGRAAAREVSRAISAAKPPSPDPKH